MNIIICGAGKVGYSICNQLSQQGGPIDQAEIDEWVQVVERFRQ